VNVLGLHIGQVGDGDVAGHQAAEPAYDHVGSTLDPDGCPAGIARYEDRVTVGRGDAAFGSAKAALRSWRPQRALGATVAPAGVRPDAGETVVLGLGIGPARLVVPNRIVAVVDQARRYGYAYGTLPGHPERGEELFLVEQHDDGTVELTIRVDAQPSPPLRRLGWIVGPLQRLALRRYLTSVASEVRSSQTAATSPDAGEPRP
jgi:uncharacterized protein (UPF0548 family)